MVKTLELAISKAASLSEAAQEQLGRELLERIDELAELRAEIEIGLRALDAGRRTRGGVGYRGPNPGSPRRTCPSQYGMISYD
jgi:hypothetical protein